VEIVFQPVVEEQTPQAPKSKFVKEEVELLQPMNKDSGKEFF
jgi:hypothetical protein